MVVLCRAEHHDSHGLSSRHRLSMHPACEQAASTLPAQKLPSIWNFSYYMLHARILSRGKSPGTACHDRFVCFRHATDGFRSESGPAQQIPPWFFPRRASPSLPAPVPSRHPPEDETSDGFTCRILLYRQNHLPLHHAGRVL